MVLAALDTGSELCCTAAARAGTLHTFCADCQQRKRYAADQLDSALLLQTRSSRTEPQLPPAPLLLLR